MAKRKAVRITGNIQSERIKADYESMGRELGALCDAKNQAYGDSFRRSGDLLKELYPDGVQPEQYQDMLAIVRVIDKLFRIATDKDAFGESPWRDVAGYGILMSEGRYFIRNSLSGSAKGMRCRSQRKS
jgi:hypothetical protein